MQTAIFIKTHQFDFCPKKNQKISNNLIFIMYLQFWNQNMS